MFMNPLPEMKLLYCYIIFVLFYFLSQSECVRDGKLVDEKDLDNFKYQVGIIILRKGGKPFKCGGGILDDWHILTAAHCFVPDGGSEIADHDSITIRAYTLINSRAAHEGSLIRQGQKIFVPNDYFSVGNADIAIIKLKKSLNIKSLSFLFGSKVEALKLPTEDFQTEGLNPVFAGYGANEVIEGKVHSDGLLRKMDVKVTPDPIKDPIFISGEPSDKSPGSPRGFCDGDSGSPLVIKDTFLGITSYKVIGVAKASNAVCDNFLEPGIYTRVSAYLDFIEQVQNDDIDDSIRFKDISRTGSCSN